MPDMTARWTGSIGRSYMVVQKVWSVIVVVRWGFRMFNLVASFSLSSVIPPYLMSLVAFAASSPVRDLRLPLDVSQYSELDWFWLGAGSVGIGGWRTFLGVV